MLLVLFQMGENKYGINADDIVRIVPFVTLLPVADVPKSIVGSFDYGGSLVPVLDLPHLVLGKSAEAILSTRIALMSFKTEYGANYLVGIAAERMTETVEVLCDKAACGSGDLSGEVYVSRIVTIEEQSIRCIDIQKLVTCEMAEALFKVSVMKEPNESS